MHLVKRSFFWLTAAAPFAAVFCAHAVPSSPSLCTRAETVAFSCQTGTKMVSLCLASTAGKVNTLTYRYGEPGNVENVYVSSPSNKQRFYGAVEPAAPRASVHQVWFKRGETTYLMTRCIGGACPQDAKLSVLRGDTIILNKRCAPTDDDRAWFSPELVKFGDDVDDSQSKTNLLLLEESDFPLREIYGIRGVW